MREHYLNIFALIDRWFERRFPVGTQPSVRRGAALAAGIIALNILTAFVAMLASRSFPSIAGLALVAWGFGLRHAMDADHIAAIDNVTRRLLYRGKPSVGVGAFFSFGHSIVVLLFTAMIAFVLPSAINEIGAWRSFGAFAGAAVSALFLLAIGFANVAVLVKLIRAWRDIHEGKQNAYHGHMHIGGPVEVIFRPLLRLVDRSAKMVGIGFLFGLGLDTATEVGLLALSAGAVGDVPPAALLVLPLAFFSGMALLDTLNGLAMLGIYAWGEIDPEHRIRYNIAMTAFSLISALGIGSLIGFRAVGVLGGYEKGVFALAASIPMESVGYLLAGLFACGLVMGLLTLGKGEKA